MTRLVPSTLPSTAEVCAYVWFWLEKHPDRRPRQADLARMIGLSPRQLRRRWHQTGRASLRDLITYGCMSYALWLIHTEGCKAVAAARQAGFVSYWNLNRQCRKYARCTVGHCRDRFPFQLDQDELLGKLAQLRTTSGNGRRLTVPGGVDAAI